MRQLLALAVLACSLQAQTPIHLLNIIPDPTRTVIGQISLFNTAQTFSIGIKAPAALAANFSLTMPVPTGSAGCWADNGVGVTTIVPCSGVSGLSSVGLTMPTGFSVGGSPLTSNGTIAVTYTSQLANLFLASPNGSSGTPSYRAVNLASADVTGNLPVTNLNGGSGATSTTCWFGNASWSACLAATNGTSGQALTSNGSGGFGTAVSFGTSGATIPLLSGGNTWGNDQNFSTFAKSVATCTWPTVTIPCWTNDNKGLASAQDYTARYTFNSAADQAQTGTYTFSGTTLTTSATVDLSWVGGKILLCPTTCTASNGTLYAVTAYLGANSLTITGTPSTPGSFSYSANAFQTSKGTMYCTSGGFCYMQNAVVTNGFTALTSANLAGTASWSGTLVTWTSGTGGAVFDLSMQGGTISLGAGAFTVQTVNSPTQVTLTASAGSGSGSWSYIGDSFRGLDGAGGTPYQFTSSPTTANAIFNSFVTITRNTPTHGSALVVSNSGTNAYSAKFAQGDVEIGDRLQLDLLGTGVLHNTASGFVTSSAVNLATEVTGSLPHANIAATAVTAGSYTNASITVAADGSLTAASSGGASVASVTCTFGCTSSTFAKMASGTTTLIAGGGGVCSGAVGGRQVTIGGMTSINGATAVQNVNGNPTDALSVSWSGNALNICSNVSGTPTAAFIVTGN